MTRVLDAHLHLWDRARHAQPWIDPVAMVAIDRDFGVDDLTEHLRRTGVDAAVLVQSTNSFAETADLLALADRAPIAAVVGWLDLAADVAPQLETLRAGSGGVKLRGIRHLAHFDPDPAWLGRPDVARGLDALAEAGLPFDLIVWAEQLPLAVQVVRAHPGLRFVLDHLGNPPFEALDQWRRDLAALAAEPNTVAKLSGLIVRVPSTWWQEHLAPAIDTALDVFGPARLMYGSDWPVAELADGGAVAWADTVRDIAGRLSEPERAMLLGGTCTVAYEVEA